MKLEEIVRHLYYIQGALGGIAGVSDDSNFRNVIGDVAMQVSELIGDMQDYMKEERQ